MIILKYNIENGTIMNSKTILGASLAAVFAVSMIAMPSFADHTTVSYLDIDSASADGSQFSMTVADDIKQLPKNKAEHLITFWAWVIPSDDDGLLKVAAVTVHHGANDHQTFGKELRSTPVQSNHPHIAKFAPNVDGDTCVAELQSPNFSFRVKSNTVTLDAEGEAWAGVAVTGWIEPTTASDGSTCFKLMVQELL